MKHLIFATTFLASVAAGAVPAFALSVSLDVPFQYSFNDGGKADSVSGYKVGFGLPLSTLGLGIGYENYAAKQSSSGVDSTATFTFYDLFLELPFPFVHITAGGGWGKDEVKVKGDIGTASIDDKNDGNASQYFVSLGFPIFPLVDLHVGYHKISADKVKLDLGGTAPSEVDASGEMWSAGVRVGF